MAAVLQRITLDPAAPAAVVSTELAAWYAAWAQLEIDRPTWQASATPATAQATSETNAAFAYLTTLIQSMQSNSMSGLVVPPAVGDGNLGAQFAPNPSVNVALAAYRNLLPLLPGGPAYWATLVIAPF